MKKEQSTLLLATLRKMWRLWKQLMIGKGFEHIFCHLILAHDRKMGVHSFFEQKVLLKRCFNLLSSSYPN